MTGAGAKYLWRMHVLRLSTVWNGETWDERRQKCDEVTGGAAPKVLYCRSCLLTPKR